MRDARSLYLGYNNTTRRAVAVNGHDIVILLRGQQHTVLEGERARVFLSSLGEISNHLCGVKWSARIAKLVAAAGSRDSERVYEPLFDEFHEHA